MTWHGLCKALLLMFFNLFDLGRKLEGINEPELILEYSNLPIRPKIATLKSFNEKPLMIRLKLEGTNVSKG